MTPEELCRLLERFKTDRAFALDCEGGTTELGLTFGRLERAGLNQIEDGEATISRYGIWADTLRRQVQLADEAITGGQTEEASRLLKIVANSLAAFTELQEALELERRIPSIRSEGGRETEPEGASAPTRADWLLQPQRLFSADEACAGTDYPPAVPGVYGWYFRNLPELIPVADCVTHREWVLAYVGISPSKRRSADGRPSSQNLRTRVRYHFRGNAEGSTLRLTLGCLLEAELGTKLRRVGSGRRMTFGPAEAKLSDWIRDNARVVWTEHAEPWVLEDELINRLSLPLNLQGNQSHPFHSTLTHVRREAKRRARE